jgi:hypothetical protein
VAGEFESVGHDGRYTIKPAGEFPPAGHAFDYVSATHRLRFYCDITDESSGPTVSINFADVEPEEFWDGRRLPRPDELPTVQDNIGAYFDRFTVRGHDLSPRESPPSVVFRWARSHGALFRRPFYLKGLSDEFISAGRTGPFRIHVSGYHFHVGDIYTYESETADLDFYTGIERDRLGLYLEIRNAVPYHMLGTAPSREKEDELQIIEENIRAYFAEYPRLAFNRNWFGAG